MLFFMRKKQHPFSACKLCMEDMRKVNIKMHMSNGSGAPGKKHRVFFYKSFHQVLGPGKIFCQLRSMIKDVEQENSPSCRAATDHINVFAKGLVVISFIDRGVSITFYIIV